MTEIKPSPPDRLASSPRSPFYDEALLERGVGIRFEGVEKTNVEEYCVSEGWVRLAAGNARTRKGEQMTIKLKGRVEPYFRDETVGAEPAREGSTHDQADHDAGEAADPAI